MLVFIESSLFLHLNVGIWSCNIVDNVAPFVFTRPLNG